MSVIPRASMSPSSAAPQQYAATSLSPVDCALYVVFGRADRRITLGDVVYLVINFVIGV